MLFLTWSCTMRQWLCQTSKFTAQKYAFLLFKGHLCTLSLASSFASKGDTRYIACIGICNAKWRNIIQYDWNFAWTHHLPQANMWCHLKSDMSKNRGSLLWNINCHSTKYNTSKIYSNWWKLIYTLVHINEFKVIWGKDFVYFLGNYLS